MASSYPSASSSTPPPLHSGGGFSTSTLHHLGQTRSRTLLFLSYRDSSGPSSRRQHSTNSNVYFDAPYTDNDDPLGSSSVNSDTEGLLPRRSREGHIALDVSPSSSSSTLPPKWLDISESVDSILLTIRPRMDTLSRLHEKHLRPGFTDKSSEEKQIESLVLDITKDFRRCSRLVAGLASYTQHLIREAKRSTSTSPSDVTVRQIALAQNVQTALATKVQDLSGAFRKQQTLYLKRMKGMEVRDRDIRSSRGISAPSSTSVFKDSELAVREDIELSKQSLLNPTTNSNTLLLQEESSSQQDTDILQRSKEIDEIAKSIQELATLFTDLQSLVIDQGTLLDRIDYNVELMGTELQGAVKELETATRYQRRSGRRQCILFLCLLIVLLIAIIIVKPFWRNARG
ncbi:t-SNARE affecting a late Golgi compartment protein 2 [Pseudozyma hubeiensis]|nr:t-SNARE affecting a late Golgi compartment protein 2 [Pseudozyma hubeiensis]